MTIAHINRITGDQNAAAPIFQQSNSNAGATLGGLIFGAPLSLIGQASNPHRLLFMQSAVMGLYIANIKYEALTTSTGFAIIGLILGLWAVFYIPMVNLLAKLTMAFIYALCAYRLIVWLNPSLTKTGDFINIKYLATDAPIVSSPMVLIISALVFIFALFMQRNLPLSQLEVSTASNG